MSWNFQNFWKKQKKNCSKYFKNILNKHPKGWVWLMLLDCLWCNPKLLKRLKNGSQNETMEKEKNRGTFVGLQHFWGKRACWSFEMGLRWIHKKKFKMKSTCTTKEKRRLLQIKRKWCTRLNSINFNHKFYMTHNLWEETPLPSL
jgi:hypothetical protein